MAFIILSFVVKYSVVFIGFIRSPVEPKNKGIRVECGVFGPLLRVKKNKNKVLKTRLIQIICYCF